MQLVLVFVFLCLSVLLVSSSQDTEKNDIEKFEEFKKRFKKKYNGAAGVARFKRWKQRKSIIERHNRANTLGQNSYLQEDNHLADQSESEWNTNLFGAAVPIEFDNEEIVPIEPDNDINDRQVAPALDLRNHPCMPPIKIQTPCGGCWAFIATTSVEFQTCVKRGNSSALNLSEQQLIDCSGTYGTKGCNGGFYSQAWDYIMATGGQTANTIYPYRAKAGKCQFTKGVTTVSGNLSKYVYLAKNERTILTALQNGPVAVSISANSNFILYSSGIFDDNTCKNGTINHGVVLVGYGTANKTDYWIVRNSWGTAWGQNGYILMKRNVNICRIAEYAFLATN